MKRPFSEAKSKAVDALDDTQQTVATLVAQQLAQVLLAPLGGAGARFGRVAFAGPEQQSVNQFLHQKLGKDSLSRRPGPGGRKLTYIESCKAIELANRAFGFNGWSCHVVECKEEFREKKSDRWSLAYSALVRIELKDGTSHEDVGFGSSDGQRDLGAALEQAKKASISDARKRALRLFGEYLGNSCYDREHIKDVISNRPMPPLAAAPGVMLPQQQQHQQPPQVTNGAMAARPPIANHKQGGQQGGLPQQPLKQQPTAQQGGQPQQLLNQQQPVQQYHNQPQPQQQQQLQRPPPTTIRPPPQQQQARPQVQPQQQQHWKPPQVLRNPMTTNGNAGVQQQQAQPVSGSSAMTSRPPVPQATTENRGVNHASSAVASSSVSSASMSNPQQYQQQQPARWGYTSNAPPPSRMMTASNPLSAIVKTEHPATNQAQPNVQFNMEDLSLSQFDYDPNTSENNAAKRMRT